MVLDRKGSITVFNSAASSILDTKADAVLDKPFASCFILDERNDEFNQKILDAVYNPDNVIDVITDYWHGNRKKTLRIITSLLKEDDEILGIIVVLSDLTELNDLKDALTAMEKIQKLNDKLAKRNEVLKNTFGRFLSDEIVEELLSTPDGLALGGRKEELTIMMSDLRGFTNLSEQMDAHDLLTMLNHYLGEMTEIIQKHQGTIIEFIGDGIMAVFGAPHYFEDHASKAVAAAVEMQRRMKAINEWNLQKGYPHLSMGIGLNTGNVIVGNIGSEKRTKYGITGKEVNLCGRIEGFTVEGELLISQNVKESVSTDLTIAEERQVVPKGAKKPMTLYKVVGVGAPYNIECGLDRKEMRVLESALEVSFVTVSGKSVENAENFGQIVALNQQEAVLITETKLEKYDNILISFNGDLYAKVMDRNEDRYTIRFTSIPIGYSFDNYK